MKNQTEDAKKEVKYGVQNYTLSFAIIFLLSYILDNYISYGIKKNPVQMTEEVIEFFRKNLWVFTTSCLVYLLQTFLAFSIEKALSRKTLPENLGMTFHVINTCVLLNFCAIFFTVIDFNPLAGQFVAAHAFHATLKLWSYVVENRKARRTGRFQQNGPDLTYPQNVTLGNLFNYMLTTGVCFYTLGAWRRGKRNLEEAATSICKLILLLYATAFVIYQYLIPEMDLIVGYLDTGEYLKVLSCFFKLTVPAFLIWFLFYYCYVFKVMPKMYTWVFGTEPTRYSLDWYNAETIPIFWQKWNCHGHLWFKKYFYKPSLERGHGKLYATIVVLLVSGLLHDYFCVFPSKNFNGIGIFSMFCQIPATVITMAVYKRFGARWGNFSVVFLHLIAQTACEIGVYYFYVKYKYGTVA